MTPEEYIAKRREIGRRSIEKVNAAYTPEKRSAAAKKAWKTRRKKDAFFKLKAYERLMEMPWVYKKKASKDFLENKIKELKDKYNLQGELTIVYYNPDQEKRDKRANCDRTIIIDDITQEQFDAAFDMLQKKIKQREKEQ
jgi:hypothetical protein